MLRNRLLFTHQRFSIALIRLSDSMCRYYLHHYARLAIKPGITGLWQVSGRSDITDFEEVVRLDKEYIENWDIAMDIKILFKTVMVVLRKDGSM